MKRQKYIFITFSFICLTILFSCLPIIYATSLPTFAVVTPNEEQTNYKTEESSIQTSATPQFNFSSKAQLLMEQTTGNIIYASNEMEQLSPASVTKIMTILLIMDAINNGKLTLADTVTCSANASSMGGSQIWFQPGETLTIDEALKCICVVSANDVCVAMSELIGGTESNFVNMMNERAKGLGMENTNFMNCHGIDEEGHYTCAKDIALMSRELMNKYPEITKYTTIWMDSIRNGTFELSNTNKLIKTYNGITGLKTGFTTNALYNLSATATRDSLSLIAVVLGGQTSEIRNNEITQLLNYGFSNYTTINLAQKDDIVQSLQVNKNIFETANLVYTNNAKLLTEKGNTPEYTTNIIMQENLNAPLKKRRYSW